MSYIIAGIGTEIGKTVVSALVCEALVSKSGGADYWKPVQAGELDHTDSDKIRDWVEGVHVHEEAFRLTQPMSPHAAADIDGVTITPQDIQRPNSDNLVTELAGGLMVPLSHSFMNVDLCAQIGDPIILVANFYLGSINHTLLSLDLIKARALPLKGIVFNGAPNLESREVILSYSQAPCLADIPQGQIINKDFIQAHAGLFQQL